jgi:L-ascorbate metabolism protein UlaG (beta-lactamase superfamily)
MRLTKFGHSCLLVEEGGARVLLDPGSFSEGFETLEGLTAVCVTHQHVDHVDPERVRPLLDRNPEVRVVSDAGSAGALGEAGADHEKKLSEVGMGSHYRLLEQLRGPGTAFEVLDDGRPAEL